MKFKDIFKQPSSFQLKEDKFIQKIGLVTITVTLLIIAMIITLFFFYMKQRQIRDLISDGMTLTSMVANHTKDKLTTENANMILGVVEHAGIRSSLIYGIVMDVHHTIIAHRGSRYADQKFIAKRASLSNNPLQQRYTDTRRNKTIYEFSRPIFRNGQKAGTVRLGFEPGLNPLFSPSEVRVILLVATLFFSVVPILYYLVRNFIRFHTLSITDELTGLYNRRGFFTFAKDCLLLAKRDEKKVMLLYADLDGLKEINDSYGHEEGDRLIQQAAHILKSTYRTSDIIARIGGDEFVVFPVGTDEDHSALIANRLEINIAEFNARKERKYQLSISIGITTYDPYSIQSLDEILATADSLMYENKQKKKQHLKERAMSDADYACSG